MIPTPAEMLSSLVEELTMVLNSPGAAGEDAARQYARAFVGHVAALCREESAGQLADQLGGMKEPPNLVPATLVEVGGVLVKWDGPPPPEDPLAEASRVASALALRKVMESYEAALTPAEHLADQLGGDPSKWGSPPVKFREFL